MKRSARRIHREAGADTRSRERGVALLVVMTLLVLFTAFVADFSYNSRVRYTMASHARDAAKAEALAQSGLRIYQLLLLLGDNAQRSLQRSPFGGMISQYIGPGSLVVKLVPCLDTQLLRFLGGGGGAPPDEDTGFMAGFLAPDDAPRQEGFLTFEGDFSVCASEEATRISLNAMARSGIEGKGARLLLQAFKREQYQPMFRSLNLTPEELLVNIIDWADPDGTRANGQGYEDNLYNRLDEPYQAKNNGYDTVSELHLVAGMTDDLYAMVSPLVTAYTEVETVALPITDLATFSMLIGALAPRQFWTKDDLARLWEQYQMNAALLPPSDAQTFLAAIQPLHPALSSLTLKDVKALITDGKKRPKVFSLTATGRVNGVERSLQVVVDIKKFRRRGGQLLYWRVE